MSDLTPEQYRYYANQARSLSSAFNRVQEQNVRYREALQKIEEREGYGIAADIAREALNA